MKTDYPDSVINKILQITLNTQTFAYLAIDRDGKLINQGGDLHALGLPQWELSDNILDEALFLAGNIPLHSRYETLPSLHISDDRVVDVHLFDDAPLIWVVLVDKTSELEWQSRARQSSNELRLLQQQIKERENCQFEFFEALNMMALRLNDDGTFDLLKPVAENFALIYPEAFESPQSLHPQDKFPFIENFLIDAEELWAKNVNHQRISSGPWVESVKGKGEVALEATAINWESQKLLFIQIMDAGYQQNHDFLQIGREGVLMKNLLEQEVRKRTADIRAREEEIALRLICAADSRDDGETGSHIRRLGLYSELMAKHLDWRQDKIDEIRIAAPMHDIGKIGIPDSILKKPGKLTAEEYEVMKTHSEIGAKILSNSKSELVKMAREIALGHHERWDGSGYPKGLAGKDIPISARIVAIADVFDALIHKRVYKEEMSIDDAIHIMQQGRGTHFDPKLFDLFIELKEQMSQIATRFDDPLCREIDT